MLPQHPPCWILSHLGSAGQENSCGESGPGRPPPTPAAAPLPAAALPRPDGGGARRRRGPRRGSAGPGPSRRVSVCFCLRGERGGRAAPEPGAQPQARPGPPPPALLRARGRRGPPGAAPGPPEAEAEARPRSGPASPAAVAPPPRPARPVRDGSRPPPLFPAGPVRGPRGLRSPPPAPPPPPAGPGAGAARPVPPAAGCRRAPLSGGAVLPGRPRGLRRRASSESPGEERGEPGIPSACFLLQIIYIFFLRVCAFYTLLLVAVKVMCKQVLVFPQMCW